MYGYVTSSNRRNMQYHTSHEYDTRLLETNQIVCEKNHYRLSISKNLGQRDCTYLVITYTYTCNDLWRFINVKQNTVMKCICFEHF